MQSSGGLHPSGRRSKAEAAGIDVWLLSTRRCIFLPFGTAPFNFGCRDLWRSLEKGAGRGAGEASRMRWTNGSGSWPPFPLGLNLF